MLVVGGQGKARHETGWQIKCGEGEVHVGRGELQ